MKFMLHKTLIAGLAVWGALATSGAQAQLKLRYAQIGRASCRERVSSPV